MPYLLQSLQLFWSAHSVFPLEKYPENLNFQSFLPLQEALVVTVNEKRAPTCRKYVAEQDIIMTNLLQSLQHLWSPSSVFVLEK